MGHSSYSMDSRHTRSVAQGYTTRSRDEIFTQQKEKKMHKDMDPKGVMIRESNDSEAHPNTIPILLFLDVTGSMGHIPHEMIKEGLPTLMGSLTQNGVPDAALMFGAIGDHETDTCPLQVGQFESGDAELDMWLTRTYLEGNGGGNGGESYLLAWYFAANHTRTDSFSKRNKKGFLFTIGDEPCLRNLPVSAVISIHGKARNEIAQGSYSAEELLAEAQKMYNVYHIFLEHGGRTCDAAWKQRMGDNLIIIDDHTKVSRVISDVILSQSKIAAPTKKTSPIAKEESTDPAVPLL